MGGWGVRFLGRIYRTEFCGTGKLEVEPEGISPARIPYNCSRPLSGFDIKFLLVKITMKFPFFRFLELRNEFYGIDLPHVGYFLCIIGQKPVQLIASFFCFCRHRPSWPLLKMDNILGSVDVNNTGDGRTLSCVPQESPSEISGPTVDVSMCSGKKKAQKKIKKIVSSTEITNNITFTNLVPKCL